MAKKNKSKQTEKNASEYYKLKTGAVDKLVDTSNAPVVSEKELKKFKSGGKIKIPSWLKVVFAKFWFGGAACYFFFWGLGMYLADLELMLVVSIGLGLVTDLLVNNLLHFFEPQKGDFDKWMLIPFRRWWTIFLNVLYSGVILFCIMNTYDIINRIILINNPDMTTLPLGVEPLLFGVFYMGFDMLFIGIKNTFVKIFRDAEKKTSGTK